MNVDDELVRGCTAEWEPGELKVPRWVAATMAVAAAVSVCTIVTVILIASGLLNQAR